MLEVYALYEQCGAPELLAAMELAHAQGAYGAAYLRALISTPLAEPRHQVMGLTLTDVPRQVEIDRALSSYKVFVWTPDPALPGLDDTLVLMAAGVPR